MKLHNFDLLVMGNIYVLNFNLIRCMVWQPELFNFFESGLFFIIIYYFLNKAHLAVPGWA